MMLASDWLYLFQGFVTTVWLAAAGIVGGVLIAVAYVPIRVLKSLRVVRVPFRAYVELVRNTPLLVQLLLVFFALPFVGLTLPPITVAVILVVLYGGAFYSGILWDGVSSVPLEQWHVSMAIGLKRRSILLAVILPQATRVAMPAVTSFTVQLVKKTSLVSVISFVDLTKAGLVINENRFEPFLVFGVIALGYFVLCFPLSRLGAVLERKVRSR